VAGFTRTTWQNELESVRGKHIMQGVCVAFVALNFMIGWLTRIDLRLVRTPRETSTKIRVTCVWSRLSCLMT